MSRYSVASETERLGEMAARGEITADDAAHRLMQASDGGLTLTGARDMIGSHREVRAVIEGIATGCRESLRAAR